MTSRTRTRLFLRVLLALAMFALTLLVGELAIRTAVPQTDPYRGYRAPPTKFRPDLRRVFDASEALHGLDGPTLFTTNSAGLRSAHELVLPKPADELRVLTLGGSTTRCTYIDDEETWPAVLEHSLRVPGRIVRVYNAGVDGERSRGHLENLVDHFLDVEADLVVVLAGINDLTEVLCGRGRSERRGPVVAAESAVRVDGLLAFKLLVSESHVARLVIHALERLSGDRYFTPEGWLKQDAAGRAYEASRERRRAEPVADVDRLDLDPSSMQRNLRLVARIGKAQGFRVVLLTQPTLWHDDLTSAEDAALHMDFRCGRRYRPAVLARELGRFNQATLEVAAEEGVIGFDAAEVIPPELDLFYDDVHFTPAGARRLGLRLGEHLSEVLGESGRRRVQH